MTLDFIPHRFKRFLVPIKAIYDNQPVAISVVGSYGNANKKPTKSSDLDLIFVFDVESTYRIYQDCLSDLHKIENLETVELGVHFQYGFVLSLYYRDSPLFWVDVGIMDVAFSKNYLVSIPRRDVFGSIQCSGIKQKPLHQMNHLARKIAKLRNEAQGLSLDTACYRYLAWLKVYSDIQETKGNLGEAEKEIIDLFRPHKNELNKEDVIKLVLDDMRVRFSTVFEASIT